MLGQLVENLQAVDLGTAVIESTYAGGHKGRNQDQSVVLQLILGDDVDDLSDVGVKSKDLVIARHNRNRAEHDGDVRLQERVEVLGEQLTALHVEVNLGGFPLLWVDAEHGRQEIAEVLILDAFQVPHHQLVLAVPISEQLGELERRRARSFRP